jgi:hypothetical protein
MVKHSKSGGTQIREFSAFIREFQTRFVPLTSDPYLIAQHQHLLAEFKRPQAAWKKRQVLVAENFNLLRTMRLTRNELCHSDILAWLLDHHLEIGTHAQGKLGFSLFLLNLDLPLKYAETDYRVVREASGQEARLDIIIEAKGQFVIGIENKVDSEEGDDQTPREWADLERRGKQLLVPRTNKIEAFFLTPEGSDPQSKRFKAISWRQIADIFEEFAEKARPPMVKLFAQHYAETLRRYVAPETEKA